MGKWSTIGTILGGVGGFAVGGPGGALTGASLGGSLGGGLDSTKKQNKYEQRAIDQAQLEWDQRAPLRRQGMQALGQVEAPMNLGHLGFNPSNPFAAARGPAPSTASYGDWGRMTANAPEAGAPPADARAPGFEDGMPYPPRRFGPQRTGLQGMGGRR